MTIFIPVLFICMNGACEFMQAKVYYQTDEQCRVSLEKQKQHMRSLVKQSGQGEFDILEGTCVDAEVKSKTELKT